MGLGEQSWVVLVVTFNEEEVEVGLGESASGDLEERLTHFIFGPVAEVAEMDDGVAVGLADTGGEVANMEPVGVSVAGNQKTRWSKHSLWT
jgi:hypothetical protein